MTGATRVVVYAGARNYSYLPTLFPIYGSSSAQIRLQVRGTHWLQPYKISITHWKRKDHSDFRCDDTGAPAHVTACIDRFIEERVGCSSAFQRTPQNRRQCTTVDQYREWTRRVSEVIAWDETTIFNKTGCLGPCDIYHYHLEDADTLTAAMLGNRTGDPTNVKIKLMIPTSSYKSYEQYLVYDYDSFIADVGGYLGLLLGHSLYSIACSLEDAVSFLKIMLKRRQH